MSAQGSQERNYHIFYQILYAASDEDLAKYCLLSREAKDFLFLSYGVSHVDRMDDNEEYGLTVDAIKVYCPLLFLIDITLANWQNTNILRN